MLYSPESHESLESRPWDPDVALGAIREIAADCEASFESLHWPVHLRDDEGDGPFTTVYLGSAGVIYALDLLARRGFRAGTRDYVAVLEQAVEVYRTNPEFEEWAHPPSMWMGETGILLALQRLAPSAEIVDRIAVLVAANAADTHREY